MLTVTSAELEHPHSAVAWWLVLPVVVKRQPDDAGEPFKKMVVQSVVFVRSEPVLRHQLEAWSVVIA